MIHGGTSEIRIYASLDDREKCLGISVKRLGLIEMLHTPLQPPLGKGKGFLGILVIRISGTTFVQSHDYVGSDYTLGVHIVFRSEDMLGAVDMRTEYASVFGKLADGAE